MPRARPHWIARTYLWLTERLYNEMAWAYDPVSWMVSLGQWSSWRLWALEYIQGPRVLEVGFGTGELLLEMARRGIQVYGMDASPAMWRQTRKKMKRQGASAPCVRGLTSQLPFPGDSFDSIISTFPAGYIFEQDTWSEVARLLRTPSVSSDSDGGRFIVVGVCGVITTRPQLPLDELVFGQLTEEMLLRIRSLAHSAGLDLRIEERRQRLLVMPILIAQKR